MTTIVATIALVTIVALGSIAVVLLGHLDRVQQRKPELAARARVAEAHLDGTEELSREQLVQIGGAVRDGIRDGVRVGVRSGAATVRTARTAGRRLAHR